MPDTSRIATHIWLKGNAREAAEFYVSLIPGSRIVDGFTFHNAGPDRQSSYTSVTFELAGQRYMTLDKCPVDLNFATSISVTCETQQAIDRLWNGLLDGGAPQQCGWLTDRYGLCWQIVPSILANLPRGQRKRPKGHGCDAVHGQARHRCLASGIRRKMNSNRRMS